MRCLLDDPRTILIGRLGIPAPPSLSLTAEGLRRPNLYIARRTRRMANSWNPVRSWISGLVQPLFTRLRIRVSCAPVSGYSGGRPRPRRLLAPRLVLLDFFPAMMISSTSEFRMSEWTPAMGR